MKHRSSVLWAMCGRRRKTRCLVAIDAGNPDRTGVSPGYRPLEGMLANFAGLQLNESVREIVSPTTKGLTCLRLFC